MLQPATLPKDGKAIPFVSDFFDFSVYIHADPEIIEEWYVTRFMRCGETAFRDPAAYFHRYASCRMKRRAKPRWKSGGESICVIWRKTFCRPASAPTLSWIRAPTILSRQSGSGSFSGQRGE